MGILDDALFALGDLATETRSAGSRAARKGAGVVRRALVYFPDADCEFLARHEGEYVHVGLYPGKMVIQHKESLSSVVGGIMKTSGLSLLFGRQHQKTIVRLSRSMDICCDRQLATTDVTLKTARGKVSLTLAHDDADKLVDYIESR